MHDQEMPCKCCMYICEVHCIASTASCMLLQHAAWHQGPSVSPHGRAWSLGCQAGRDWADASVSLQNEGDKLIVAEKGDLVFVFNFHPVNSYSDYRVGTKHAGPYKVGLVTCQMTERALSPAQLLTWWLKCLMVHRPRGATNGPMLPCPDLPMCE